MCARSKLFDHVRVNPPVATTEDTILEIHGDRRVDPYYWLRNRDEKRVLDYLEEENAYREKVMSHLRSFEDQLFEEIKARIKEDDESVPYLSNGYYYLTRFEKGLEYPIYTRKKGSLADKEEVLLDINVMANSHDYYHASGLSVSPDNNYLSFGEDTVSRRIYTIRFKDLTSGQFLEDSIPNTTGRAVWANDNKTLFYAVKDETLRSCKIFRHTLGTDAADDVEIYHETDPTYNVYVSKSTSRKYIIISSHQTLSTEYRYLDANDAEGEFEIFQKREKALEYHIHHFEDHWYIRTNLEAPNFQLMRSELDKTGKEFWRPFIAHRPDVLLTGVTLFRHHLVLDERYGGLTNIRIRAWMGDEHIIDFNEEVYMASTAFNPEMDADQVRVHYTSLTTPNSVMDYDMNQKKLELKKQQEVVGKFTPTDYRSERLTITARDGTNIPVSLVYHKSYRKDGTQPLLLYAYGSYGYSMDPYFSSVRLSLLDRGFAYAIAHIRGGQEMGRQWYEDGKLLLKKNTFNDFIDCGQFLVDHKICGRDQLYAMGGSAGGLLMGAVVNERPDLWAGIVAAVPFVDVITTMLDDSIPLTTGEYDEWGNPNDVDYYTYMKSYSPYDNVAAKDYPPMLITTGYHDSQVQYWEPAKWTAKLRALKTGQNPLLLYCNMKTGHGGASGRYEQLREVAMEYAFLLDLANRAK